MEHEQEEENDDDDEDNDNNDKDDKDNDDHDDDHDDMMIMMMTALAVMIKICTSTLLHCNISAAPPYYSISASTLYCNIIHTPQSIQSSYKMHKITTYNNP